MKEMADCSSADRETGRHANTCAARYIQHKNIQIWVEAFGRPEHPAVLLISGAGAHAHFWTDTFCAALAQQKYYVIRFDHRDCGLSSAIDFSKNPYAVSDLADDVLAIMDALCVKQAHVVGHSMGGTIAQLLAIFHPERVLSFTSISVCPVGTSISISEETMAALLENKPTQNFEASLNGFMKSWRLLNGELPLDVEMAKEYTKELYTRSIHAVGVAWNHIRCQESLPLLPCAIEETSIPGLFIHGEKDCLVPAQPYVMHSELIKITMVPKMGHMMFNTQLQQQIAQMLLMHFSQSSA